MAVAIARLGIALDERVRRNWFRSRITFVEESSKRDRHLGLSSSHNLIGNADCLIVKSTCTEVWMEGDGWSNEVDVVRRIGIDRCSGNVSVPQTGGLKWHKTVKAGELTDRHPTASSSLRKCGLGKQKQSRQREGKREVQSVSHMSP